ncbi:MAG: enoyl-CoA hydratase-related protein [Rhodoblastus sp.]
MVDDLMIDETGPIAIFSFNRPSARNALTLEMLTALEAGLRRCASRDDMRAVVLRGAGEQAFSAGYNVDQLSDAEMSLEDARLIHEPIRAVADAIVACPHPVIAAARKFIFGAALDIFCHCDLRVCSQGTTFCMPPNRFGFLYHSAGIHRLASIVGVSRATQMLLLGSPVPTESAAAWGLTHCVYADNEFESELDALCEVVARNAPLSMRGTKRVLNEHAEQAGARDQAALDKMYAEIVFCLNSADVREGRAAFAEKRAPRFQGK